MYFQFYLRALATSKPTAMILTLKQMENNFGHLVNQILPYAPGRTCI